MNLGVEWESEDQGVEWMSKEGDQSAECESTENEDHQGVGV